MNLIELKKGESIVPVKGFESRFLITDHGRLFSINGRRKGIKELTVHIDSLGYRNTQLRMNPKKRQVRIHQLVGEHFVDNPYNKPQLNHIDGNKLNNHYTNLEWCTIAENMKHAFRIGLINRTGENHENAILKDSDITKIFELRRTGFSMKIIGYEFGVNRKTIADVLNGKCWTHISGL